MYLMTTSSEINPLDLLTSCRRVVSCVHLQLCVLVGVLCLIYPCEPVYMWAAHTCVTLFIERALTYMLFCFHSHRAVAIHRLSLRHTRKSFTKLLPCLCLTCGTHGCRCCCAHTGTCINSLWWYFWIIFCCSGNSSSKYRIMRTKNSN